MKLPAWFAKAFPAPASGCGRGGMCRGDAACADRLCPGHPAGAAAYSHVDPLPVTLEGEEPRELSDMTRAIVIAGITLALGIVGAAALLGAMP